MTYNKSIILTIFSLQGGGAERFVLTLAQGFKKLGYQPHIVCFKDHVDYDMPMDIPVHFLNYQGYRWIPKSIRNKLFAKVFDGFIRKHISKTPYLVLSNLWQVDSVLTHSQLSNKVFVIHNTLSKEKIIHIYLTDEALKAVYQNQHIVAVSKGVQTDFSTIVKQIKSISAIYNPIDRQSVIQLANQIKLKDIINDEQFFQLNKGYIVHVGKFKEQKNHIGLINAYAQTDKKLPLVLVGQGKLQLECKQLCQTLNITDKVIFTDFQANPYPWIVNASSMVLSSIYEGFGIVIAEALALGVPVISTDCESGPRELLPTDNLVAVNDVQALADKIQDLMDNPSRFSSDFDESLLPETVAKRYLQVVGVSC